MNPEVAKRNTMRAKRAEGAIVAYAANEGCGGLGFGDDEDEIIVGDLLVDLMHLFPNIDFADLVARSTVHYAAEIAGEDE